MDKETIKRIINEFIDDVDEIVDFSISDDYEEIDASTLDEEIKIRKPTGLTNIFIQAYKER